MTPVDSTAATNSGVTLVGKGAKYNKARNDHATSPECFRRCRVIPRCGGAAAVTPPVLPASVREPFSPFGRLCHALKKDWRALYWNSCTGTINLPPPWLWRASASLNNKRVVGWVKFSAHHAPKSKRGSAKMICLHGETPLIPRFNNRIYWGSCIGPAHLRKPSALTRT